MVVKKSCVAAYPVGWPDGRGISGRMRVEWVAGSTWNRWSDAHGMGGQMTVESATSPAELSDEADDLRRRRVRRQAQADPQGTVPDRNGTGGAVAGPDRPDRAALPEG